MKREVKRQRKVPAFRCDIAALEALVNKLLPLFENGDPILSISVKLKNEEFDFDTIAEMRSNTSLPTVIFNFNMRISDVKSQRRCWLDCSGFLGSTAEFTAFSDNEAWCAGAVEVACAFLSQFKVWYGNIRGWPLIAVFLFSMNLPTIGLLTGQVGALPKMAFYAYGLITIVTGLILANRRRLLPAAIVTTRDTQPLIRKYLPEITFAVSILALALTIIGWFIK